MFDVFYKTCDVFYSYVLHDSDYVLRFTFERFTFIKNVECSQAPVRLLSSSRRQGTSNIEARASWFYYHKNHTALIWS